MRFRRHIRGQVGPHRTPRPDHDGMVAATAAAAYRLFEPRFSPLGNNHRVARNEQGCFRQWAAQLRSGASAARGVARQRFHAPHDCVGEGRRSRYSLTTTEWLKTVVKIETSNEEFYRLFRQALEDMAALRLPIRGTGHTIFLPAAGLPWFVAPFGRDSLIVSLQNVLVYPEFARGALEILGSLQAKDDDPYRDAEPGKILHELRYGELAHFKLIPHTPYYGTADATPLYLITLHAAWRATGDKALLERHLPTAEGCLAWIDKYGDRDGDGFQEYQTRSSDRKSVV